MKNVLSGGNDNLMPKAVNSTIQKKYSCSLNLTDENLSNYDNEVIFDLSAISTICHGECVEIATGAVPTELCSSFVQFQL
jgi:hypothetical protein